ncbi:hypothetical protein [Saccharothrix syringae]|uniref:Secreted protein n=1 Tax=Saccharothrix syringae TaxID=103733 RepID=A0A5Q0HA50_SACSY|nr:hypothetical protein [Saccharothrix syringae]QFZ23101.1 hypothetical protein EKG83_41775 [Saccharothrix syringae]
MRISRNRRLALLAATALALGLVPAVAPAALADDTAVKLDAADFQLRRSANDADYNALVAALPNVAVPAVLDDANRTARRLGASEGQLLSPAFAAGFAWQDGDDHTPDWRPQGITTSSDAYDDGLYQGRKVVLVSWYGLENGTAADKGARISFVDRTDPLKPVYRHVLLVEPTTSGGQPSFASTDPNHAGGITWYGDLLYVASTDHVRVYDLRDILKVSTADDTKIGRAANGAYYAYGYQYVLPQKFTYRPVDATKNIRFSAIALDRSTTPDSVIVTEYSEIGDGSRLFRWDINADNRELFAANGVATASWAYQVNIISMQGAAAVDGGNGPDNATYYITRSKGESTRGDLLVWKPGNLAKMYPGMWPIGPEDMAYRKSTDEMWTVTEYADMRYVLSITAATVAP